MITKSNDIISFERSPRGASGALFVTTSDGRKVAKNVFANSNNEIAAYIIDTALGWNLVPKTIGIKCAIGDSNEELFSFQDFIENSWTWDEFCDEFSYFGWCGITGVDEITYSLEKQYALMRAFDFIVNNSDRHGENYLIDIYGKLWAIDSGLCFQSRKLISYSVEDIPEYLKCCNDTYIINTIIDSSKNLLTVFDTIEVKLSQYLDAEQIGNIKIRLLMLIGVLTS